MRFFSFFSFFKNDTILLRIDSKVNFLHLCVYENKSCTRWFESDSSSLLLSIISRSSRPLDEFSRLPDKAL